MGAAVGAACRARLLLRRQPSLRAERPACRHRAKSDGRPHIAITGRSVGHRDGCPRRRRCHPHTCRSATSLWFGIPLTTSSFTCRSPLPFSCRFTRTSKSKLKLDII